MQRCHIAVNRRAYGDVEVKILFRMVAIFQKKKTEKKAKK